MPMFDDVLDELQEAVNSDNSENLLSMLEDLDPEELEENSDTLFELATTAATSAAFECSSMLFAIPVVAKEARDRLLRYAHSDDTPDRINSLLSTPMLPQNIILATNENGMNALHIAMANKNIDTAQALLATSEFIDNITSKDSSGRTAINIANEEGFTEGLSLLNEYGLINEETDKNAKNDLSQAALDPKLLSYLESSGMDPTLVLGNEGNCNGWAFLYQIYATNDKEDEFYAIQEAIADWDGDMDSLDTEQLPESLTGKYSNMRDLLEQVSNDLALFFYATEATNELNLGLGQKSRIQQYDLTKDPNEGRELGNIFNYSNSHTSKEQLVEMLDFCARWPGTSVDIGGGQHATSLFITEKGELKYYDPNMKGRKEPFTSTEELADYIIATKYKKLGKLNDDDTVDISLDLYKFYPRGTNVPDVLPPTHPLPLESANEFSPLHVAILENDVERVKALLAADPAAASAKDANGITPLHMAMTNHKKETLELLLNAPGLDINMPDNHGMHPFMIALNSRDPNMVSQVINHPEFKMDNNRDYVIRTASMGIPEIFNMVLEKSHGFKDTLQGEMTALMVLCNNGNVEMINKLLTAKNYDPDINARDFLDFTALMRAVQKDQKDVVKALLAANARTDLKADGKTALDMARDNPEMLTILKAHQAKHEVKAPEPKKPEEAKPSQAPMKSRPILFSQVQKSSPPPEPSMRETVESAQKPKGPSR